MVQAKKYILSYLPGRISGLLDSAVDDENWSQLQEIRLCASGSL